MGDLMGYDDWLQAQNRLLGTALLDPTLAPRVITELTPEDFAGPAKRIYQVMAELFRSSNSPEGVDAVAVAAGPGKARAILAVLRHHRHHLLVIDEGAAREIERILSEEPKQ